MNKLEQADLLSLEAYASTRAQFRKRLMTHKKNRQIAVGPHARLYFEDQLTIQYQIQEMLYAERIFEPSAIQEELDTYNPLIPDDYNLKATFMIEFEQVEERRQALKKMVGIENTVWIQVGDMPRVTAYADEDLERSSEEKTSAVHFLRFELSPDMICALKTRLEMLSIGIDHTFYQHAVSPLPEPINKSLIQDLAPPK